MNIFEPSGRASIPAWMAAKARSSERGFFGSLQLINGDREYAVVWDEEEKLNARHHHQAMLSNTRCKLAERGRVSKDNGIFLQQLSRQSRQKLFLRAE